MHIRRATSQDLEQLTELFIAFKEGLTKYEPEDLKVFRGAEKPIVLIQKAVREEIENENGLFLVAEEQNTLVGFGYATCKENNHMVFETVLYGVLNHIWIDEAHRGRGLASDIKNTMFAWFTENNCEYVEVSVLDTNPAKHVYEKWGFETVLDTMRKLL